MAYKFLIVGDEYRNDRILLGGAGTERLQVQTANTRGAVAALLEREAFHAACVDLRMQEDDAEAIVEQLRARAASLPVIALLASRDGVVMRRLRGLGVVQCLTGPCSAEVLRRTLVARAVPQAVGPAREIRPPSPREHPPTAFVARDDAACRMVEIARRAAASNVSILVLGETGTGKNLLAQMIHELSPLKAKPFVTVSCPSLNRELLESDLFGHVRGAFTGAVQDTWGKVAAADGGALFLDEIGDLPAALQPKLLRLLQEKQYERVGETVSRRANVRIIAATNRDLKAEVADGRFREDLFYRLNVITLEVPPLRRRPSDIMAAAELFLESICAQLNKPVPAFDAETRRLLEGYAWPGNLRELRNAVERAAVLSDRAVLAAGDFPALLAPRLLPRYEVGAAVSLQALENAHIQSVVANCATLEEAARILEIDKSTLYRKRKAMEGRVENFAPAEEPVAAVAE